MKWVGEGPVRDGSQIGRRPAEERGRESEGMVAKPTEGLGEGPVRDGSQRGVERPRGGEGEGENPEEWSQAGRRTGRESGEDDWARVW